MAFLIKMFSLGLFSLVLFSSFAMPKFGQAHRASSGGRYASQPACSFYLKRSGGTMHACSVAVCHHSKRAVPPVTVSAVCGKPPFLHPPPVVVASTASHLPMAKCLSCGKPPPAPRWGAGGGAGLPTPCFRL